MTHCKHCGTLFITTNTRRRVCIECKTNAHRARYWATRTPQVLAAARMRALKKYYKDRGMARSIAIMLGIPGERVPRAEPNTTLIEIMGELYQYRGNGAGPDELICQDGPVLVLEELTEQALLDFIGAETLEQARASIVYDVRW